MDHGTPLPLDGGAARETQALPVLVRSRLPVHQEGEPRPADYLIGQNQHKRTPYVLHKFEGVRPAQAGRSSKLVKNTLLRRALKAELHREQPAYKVMRYRYWKNAHVQELTWSNAKLQKCHKRVERSLTPEERLMNQKRAVVRAKTHLRRDILTIGADRMFTLTYRFGTALLSQFLRKSPQSPDAVDPDD